MIISGIALLSIAALVLLIFIVHVIDYARSGGNSFRILGSIGAKLYLPVFLVFVVCVIAGILMVVFSV